MLSFSPLLNTLLWIIKYEKKVCFHFHSFLPETFFFLVRLKMSVWLFGHDGIISTTEN